MNVRELACRSLLTICKDDGYSNIVVSQTIEKNKLTDRDRRFYTELVYGTLRHVNYLDWIIGQLSSRSLSRLDPLCLVIVRLGIYQIYQMDKVPESAACNESVNLATKLGNSGMAKFVNAMLRGSIRRKSEFVIPAAEDDLVRHLSLTYHQQEWLIKKWLQWYGAADTLSLCRYFDGKPELCLRTNTTVTTRQALMEKLRQADIACHEAVHSSEGIYLETNPGMRRLEQVVGKGAIVQDEPSQLVAHVVGPQPSDVIFDICAAPGGKTTHLAALGGNKAVVYGCDIYEHKIKLIEDNARRLGLTNVRPLLQDGMTIGDIYSASADRVLVDAPCSGLGVLRHKLDLRWRKRPGDLRNLPQLQLLLLTSAAKCVKPGGVLVYSTCTLNDGENGAVVDAFLKEHGDFTVVPIGSTLGFAQAGPYLQLLPQRDGLDGFFIAKMIKEGTP